ncbi:hypothetical protein MASR1M66_16210 [Aminivibrio sp.]
MIDILEGAPAWIILTHVKPDGDTLGSGSALYSLGASLGKKVFWGGEDPYPRGYSFLPEAGSYIPGIDPGELLHREGGAAIILDTSTEDRSLPGVRALSEKFPVINIDHHGDNELFGSLNWIDRRFLRRGDGVEPPVLLEEGLSAEDGRGALYCYCYGQRQLHLFIHGRKNPQGRG